MLPSSKQKPLVDEFNDSEFNMQIPHKF